MTTKTKHFIGWCIIATMAAVPFWMFVDIMGWKNFLFVSGLIIAFIGVLWIALTLIYSK